MLALASVAVLAVAAAPPPAVPDYKNPRLPVERRVADLLSRMTLQEKIAQLEGIWKEKSRIEDARGDFDPAKAASVLADGIGEITRPGEDKGPRRMAEFTDAVQQWVMTHTRLGIPVMFHEECLHGEEAPGGTSFPQAIGLAGTWDPALVQQVFGAVAQEVRARGAQQCLAPVLDLGREPRWGRIEETYGEDPYLVSRIGAAAVRGYQGVGPNLDDEHVWATLKHFAGHGQPEAGTNVAPGDLPLRLLRQDWLYPFRYAVVHAHAASVMASYNEIDGIPSHANRWLLQRILRQEWGFRGFVVSDYFGITQLETLHHVVAAPQQAAALALASGVDLELPDPAAYPYLPQLVAAGRVSMQEIDAAVAPILRAKFRAGLFDRPTADPARAVAVTNSPAHRALALRAALETITLLKNDHGLLPLDPARLKTVAVIGPNADQPVLGEYSGQPGHVVTVLEGIKARLGPGVKVVYAEGCRITAPGGGWGIDEVKLPDPQRDAARLAAAERLVREARPDAIILVLGGNDQVSREAYSPTHLGDMDNLKLVGRQLDLAKAMLATGRPVAVVLLNGRPYSIDYLAAHAPAILEGWYLGEETGAAVAQVLFGDYDPAGRLPVSIARNVGQLPIYYDHKPSAKRGYLFSNAAPLFPFGWGLSYTTFRYSNLRLDPASIGPQGTTRALVDVTNTGTRAGDDVVQLYIRHDVAFPTQPVEELKGFERIHLAPGQTQTVSFPLGPERLSFYGLDMRREVEPGPITVMVGGSSLATLQARLQVTP